MWSVRSVGDRVVPAFFCIIFTLIAGGAQAQKATDASDSKRVQVLQVKEGAAAKEIAVKKPKSAATHAKKKVAHRNNLSQTKAATNEAATPAQDDISRPAAEQAGTLSFGDRVVAFASSPGDNNDVGLSVANQVGAIGEPASALAVVNPPRANVDAEQSSTNQMLGRAGADRRVPSVTSLSNVERGNGGGRVRLVSCQFKPEAHFVKRRHVASITEANAGQSTVLFYTPTQHIFRALSGWLHMSAVGLRHPHRSSLQAGEQNKAPASSLPQARYEQKPANSKSHSSRSASRGAP